MYFCICGLFSWTVTITSNHQFFLCNHCFSHHQLISSTRIRIVIITLILAIVIIVTRDPCIHLPITMTFTAIVINHPMVVILTFNIITVIIIIIIIIIVITFTMPSENHKLTLLQIFAKQIINNKLLPC